MAISVAENESFTLPIFSENQVLRARDLNNLVNLVTNQLRINRMYSVGLGIVEGFKARWVEDLKVLVVERGFGVSSNGYGFDLDACTFTHIRKIENSFKGYTQLAGECGRYDDLMTALTEGGYELGSPGPRLPIDESWLALTNKGQLGAGEYCLLYLYREEKIVQASCFNKCEGKGAEQAGKYHAVLLAKAAFQWKPDGTGSQAGAINLPDVPLLRAFGYNAKAACVNLCEIGDWSALYGSYRDACTSVQKKLVTAYGAAQLALEPSPPGEGEDMPNPDGQPLAQELKKNLDALLRKDYREDMLDDCTDIQYFYTYLQELITAYAALHHLLEGKNLNLGNSDESANTNIRYRFPGYLGIGCVDVAEAGELAGWPVVRNDDGVIDVCRTERILPDTSTERQTLLEVARALLKRMKNLANPQNLLLPTWQKKGLTDLRITPDNRRFPFLRGRALPFYYEPNSVKDYWRVGEQPNLGAFHYAGNDGNHPALYAGNIRDFYRVEGHLGSSLVKTETDAERETTREVGVKHRLESLRDCYNLAFDVVAVKLDLPAAGTPAPPIAGSARDAWYKNTRADLLQILACYKGNEGEVIFHKEIIERAVLDEIDVAAAFVYDNPIDECCLTVASFLNRYENLYDLEDWEELKGVDFCTPLPNTLTSVALNDFVDCYNELSEKWEALRNGKQNDGGHARTDIPRLDLALGACIRDEAIRERLARETIWRNQFLAGFARTHPGLVHRGGVENGGTIVLVCKTQVDRLELLRLLLGIKGSRVAELKALDDDKLLQHAEGENIDTSLFVSQTVVADFSLPYRCCGAGPVHLQEAPLVPVMLTVTAGSDCVSEAELKEGLPVEYTVSEAGGKIIFLVKDREVDAIETGTVAAGPASVNNLSDGDFTDGRAEIKARYTKDSRSTEIIFAVFRQPTLEIKSQDFTKTVFRDGQGYLLFNLRFWSNAAPKNWQVFVEEEEVEYDPESGELWVPVGKKGALPAGRVSVRNGNCLAEETLDFCAVLPVGMTLKTDCGPVKDFCKIECSTPLFTSSDAEATIQLDLNKLESGLIELCPAVPGGTFEVTATIVDDREQDFNANGLVLVQAAAVDGEPICRYYLVLNFKNFAAVANTEEDPLGCYRLGNNLFPFQLNEKMPESSLVSVVLNYSYGECEAVRQTITVGMIKEDGGGDEKPADPVPTDPKKVEDPAVGPSTFARAVTIPAAATATLNARRAKRQAELETLGKAAGLAEEPAFRRAFSYLSVAGEGADPKRGLDATLKALVKLSVTQPDFAEEANAIMKLVTTSFLDKLALSSTTKKLTVTEKNLIEKVRTGLKKLQVSANTTHGEWGVSELYGGPEKARLTAIGKKLRE